ncbi:Uncharacterized protein TCAP_07339 [Tolypocladium capitatum]|uniref:Uncharacterized protein n=1 Tax=Tolypocladium capitatum TaxID=45235 RepID=A0A2K3PZE6_9HYPO|nr:Uncharacterized protein TCAP_07339 [Tolypocladium capitatum]
MKFANFPILIPAFTAQPNLAQIYIDTPLAITADLLAIPFLPTSGRLVSEPSYPYALRATFVHGSDYLRRDPDGRHVRLDVRSVARDDGSGALLKFSYNGVVDVTGDAGKVIAGDRNASTTGFGSAFVQVRFETQDQRLQDIENKLYVGSGRFIVQESQPIVVEYKISEVAAACAW